MMFKMRLFILLMKNNVSCYNKNKTGRTKDKFEKEMKQWLKEKILLSWNYKVEGIIPLMVIEQPIKQLDQCWAFVG